MKDGTPTTSSESDDKSETPDENSKTEKQQPPRVPNRGRTFGATGTEKRG